MALTLWYKEHARKLPWRETGDPYCILVSEVMLQQTRVTAVLDYYARFLAALPDLASLARCGDDRLLKLWEGLGYYSRARNLKRAAQCAMERFGGRLPQSYEQLRTLPGLGPYTAGAVASIAFGERVPAVDGNVLRVLARLFADESDIALPATRARVRAELLQEMPEDAPGQFNQALMELGATVCLPGGAPRCAVCPLNARCRANALGAQARLPVKTGKRPRRVEEKTVFALLRGGAYLGYRRADTGLLAGLWQLPDEPGALSPEEAAARLSHWGLRPVGALGFYERTHIFTHIEWRMRVCSTEVTGDTPPGWTALDDTVHSLPAAYRVCLPKT